MHWQSRLQTQKQATFLWLSPRVPLRHACSLHLPHRVSACSNRVPSKPHLKQLLPSINNQFHSCLHIAQQSAIGSIPALSCSCFVGTVRSLRIGAWIELVERAGSSSSLPEVGSCALPSQMQIFHPWASAPRTEGLRLWWEGPDYACECTRLDWAPCLHKCKPSILQQICTESCTNWWRMEVLHFWWWGWCLWRNIQGCGLS